MSLLQLQARRIRLDEYHRMAECGILGPEERVELIDGIILPLSPQNLPHSTSIRLINMLLTRLFGATHVVSCQAPLAAGEDCEPEPDFAVMTFDHMNECLARKSQPTRPDLVIEVADSSLLYDTSDKANLYARAGIPEYWVVDLPHRRLEIRRQPAPAADATFGHAYCSVLRLSEQESASTLFAPEQAVPIGAMLPPADL